MPSSKYMKDPFLALDARKGSFMYWERCDCRCH